MKYKAIEYIITIIAANIIRFFCSFDFKQYQTTCTSLHGAVLILLDYKTTRITNVWYSQFRLCIKKISKCWKGTEEISIVLFSSRKVHKKISYLENVEKKRNKKFFFILISTIVSTMDKKSHAFLWYYTVSKSLNIHTLQINLLPGKTTMWNTLHTCTCTFTF